MTLRTKSYLLAIWRLFQFVTLPVWLLFVCICEISDQELIGLSESVRQKQNVERKK